MGLGCRFALIRRKKSVKKARKSALSVNYLRLARAYSGLESAVADNLALIPRSGVKAAIERVVG
jgi:hypothetical protein